VISPGNLYYHFRNKEEIIRIIFDMIISEFDQLYGRGEEMSTAVEGFFSVFIRTGQLYYKYRFFYIELATLLSQDQELKKKYTANMNNRFRQQREYYRALVRDGILKQPPDKELEESLTIGWIISDFWLTWLYVSDAQITEENISRSVRHVYLLLKPYLTSGADEKILKMLP
jgi:AcrR family transcriptional regulator